MPVVVFIIKNINLFINDIESHKVFSDTGLQVSYTNITKPNKRYYNRIFKPL